VELLVALVSALQKAAWIAGMGYAPQDIRPGIHAQVT